MIHSHALIKVACKIFGFMYLVGAVSTLGLSHANSKMGHHRLW